MSSREESENEDADFECDYENGNDLVSEKESGADDSDEIDPALLQTVLDGDDDTDFYDEDDIQTDGETGGGDDGAITDETERPKLAWTGHNKRLAVLLFKADSIVVKCRGLKAIAEDCNMAFKIAKSDCKILRNLLLCHGLVETGQNSNAFNIMWTGAHIKPPTFRVLTEFQKVNHFPRSFEITRKDRLFKNIQRMQQLKGLKNFDFIPHTFVVPGEFQDFCNTYAKDKGPWIVKPVASSRGRGVFLVTNPQQVPLDENIIVSKYIKNPMLVDGFKFDIRFYVLVTSYDPLIIYLYEEGLTRFATVRYEKGTKFFQNPFMHLTNYSVNKKNEDYVCNDNSEFEDYGNKWSLGAFLRHLRSEGKDATALMLRVEDVIIKTIISAELTVCAACKIFVPHRQNCFELYGFDILVDKNLRPWLLEVNLSPSLACDAPLDLKIKARMLADLLSLVGVAVHNPLKKKHHYTASEYPYDTKKASAYTLDESADSSNYQSCPHKPSPTDLPKNYKPVPPDYFGELNPEEIQIVRRAKEEYLRRGGWVRVFPSPDSWEMYNSFFQYPSHFNLMLWQQLYPERAFLSYNFRHAMKKKPAYLHSSQFPQLCLSPQLDCETEYDWFKDQSLEEALQRSVLYERKLAALGGKKKYRKDLLSHLLPPIDGRQSSHSNRFSKQQHCLSASAAIYRNAFSFRNATPTRYVRPKPPPKPLPRIKPNSAAHYDQRRRHRKPSSFSSRRQGRSRKYEPSSPSENTPSDTDTTDDEQWLHENSWLTGEAYDPEIYKIVTRQLKKGVNMSPVQARLTFTMYLTHLRQRLPSIPFESSQSVANEEELELVLGFLTTSCSNLYEPIKIDIPNPGMTLLERRMMVGDSIADFVMLYNKDTFDWQSYSTDPVIANPTNLVEERGFEKFLLNATEEQLEKLLSDYLKKFATSLRFSKETTQLYSAQARSQALLTQQLAELLASTGDTLDISAVVQSVMILRPTKSADSGFCETTTRSSSRANTSGTDMSSKPPSRAKMWSGKSPKTMLKMKKNFRPISATLPGAPARVISNQRPSSSLPPRRHCKSAQAGRKSPNTGRSGTYSSASTMRPSVNKRPHSSATPGFRSYPPVPSAKNTTGKKTNTKANRTAKGAPRPSSVQKAEQKTQTPDPVTPSPISQDRPTRGRPPLPPKRVTKKASAVRCATPARSPSPHCSLVPGKSRSLVRPSPTNKSLRSFSPAKPVSVLRQTSPMSRMISHSPVGNRSPVLRTPTPGEFPTTKKIPSIKPKLGPKFLEKRSLGSRPATPANIPVTTFKKVPGIRKKSASPKLPTTSKPGTKSKVPTTTKRRCSSRAGSSAGSSPRPNSSTRKTSGKGKRTPSASGPKSKGRPVRK